jgi:uncharacterized integral membrane protein (TIGR00698 family)
MLDHRAQPAHVILAPGLLLTFAIAVIAYGLGLVAPIVGGPVFGIVLGVIVTAVRAPGAAFKPGIRFSSKTLLQTSIVILGTSLDLGQLIRVGAGSLPVLFGTMAICLGAAALLGRWLNLDATMRTLLGVGTAICGASAIAAVSSVIVASEAEIAYSISTVFLYNVAAVLTFPAIGHALHLSSHAFGLFAGTAINDTSSVVAAGYTYGKSAGDDAVVVKLTRATLIVPLVAFFAIRGAKRGVPWKKVIPWFIVWFVVAVAANTAGLIPAILHKPLTLTGLFLIIVALTGVGLGSNIAEMRRAGWRPIALGGALWILVAVSSLLLANASGVR